MKLFAELREHSYIWPYRRIVYAPISLFVTFIYREFYKPVDNFIARLHLIYQPYVAVLYITMNKQNTEYFKFFLPIIDIKYEVLTS